MALEHGYWKEQNIHWKYVSIEKTDISKWIYQNKLLNFSFI